jgi:hypothetical protein
MEMPTHHAVRLACGIALYLLFLAWVIWPKKREVDDNPEIPPNVFLPRGCKCSMTREGENFIVAHNPACPILRHRPDVNE